MAAFDDEDALVIIVTNYITVREALQSEGAVNVILEVLHRHLIPEVLIVHLGCRLQLVKHHIELLLFAGTLAHHTEGVGASLAVRLLRENDVWPIR